MAWKLTGAGDVALFLEVVGCLGEARAETGRRIEAAPLKSTSIGAISRRALGSSRTGPSPRLTETVRASSPTCRYPHRLYGPTSQLLLEQPPRSRIPAA